MTQFYFLNQDRTFIVMSLKILKTIIINVNTTATTANKHVKESFFFYYRLDDFTCADFIV